jgi:hypothetical protein
MGRKYSYEFIRFGVLSPMDHKKRYGGHGFHSPPKKKGFYAFPHNGVDKFLLTATNHPSNPSNKSYWLKDDDGNKITTRQFYEKEYNEKTGNYIIKIEYIKLLKKRNIQTKNIFDVMGEDDDIDENGWNRWYVCVYKKPNVFNYSGEIWCHLGEYLTPDKIISEKGSWVKIEMDSYILALKKYTHSLRKDMMKTFGVDWKDKNPLNVFTKDILEVFIEKI